MDQLHNKFVQDLLEGSKLFPDNPYSLLPTVIFLVTTFVLIYRQFHKNTYNSTSLKSKLCKVSKRPEKVVLVLYCDLVFIGFDFSMDLLLHHKDLVHIFESLQMDGAFFRKFFIGNFSVLQRLESYNVNWGEIAEKFFCSRNILQSTNNQVVYVGFSAHHSTSTVPSVLLATHLSTRHS